VADDSIRLTFHDGEELSTRPDESKLPAMPGLDADPAVAAEVAVERGIATPEQADYVEQCESYDPYLATSEDTDEVEISAEQEARARAARRSLTHAYFPEDDAHPVLVNEDGSTTRLVNAQPDPREEQED
jgi:hypothetical protein